MNVPFITIGIVAAVIVLGFIALGMAMKAFYVVPKADEALIRTGGGSPSVSVGGGMLIVPLFHEVSRVSLQAIRIPISRTKNNALPTADKLMAEIEGELIVKIEPSKEEDIIKAVQSLGITNPDEMAESVKGQIDSLVTDALRTAAFKKSFLELNSEKKDFADEVLKLLQDDLTKLGLTLTAVTVPNVKQGDFPTDLNDVFAAEGRRNVAMVVEKNRQETNKITREAEVQVQGQDVDAREQYLALELRQRQKEADQAREVAEYEAQQAAITRAKVLEQEQAIAQAEAAQARAVEEARIAEQKKVDAARIAKEAEIAIQDAKAAADRAVAEEEAAKLREAAEISRAQALEAARIEKEKTISVATELRTQAEEEAKIARQVAIAQKLEEEARARASQAEAEALQRKAEEQVQTVRETAVADRAKQIVTIKAEEEASRDRIAADREAYVVTKKAEAERDSAVKRAEAERAEAEGKAAAVKAEAAGEKDAVSARAEAYAYDRKTRAEAEFEASAKEASARRELATAILEEGRAQAESERLLQEARNSVSDKILAKEVILRALDVSPAVVREVAKPLGEVAKGIQIVQISGAGGGDGQAQSIPGAIMSSAAQAVGIAPIVKTLLSSPEAKSIVDTVKRELKVAAKELASDTMAGMLPEDTSEAIEVTDSEE